MLTVDEIRKELTDRNLSAVSRATGVSLGTIYNFMRGNKEPFHKTVVALNDYLEKNNEPSL